MKFLLAILIPFYTLLLYSQPGGGGGLVIQKFYLPDTLGAQIQMGKYTLDPQVFILDDSSQIVYRDHQHDQPFFKIPIHHLPVIQLDPSYKNHLTNRNVHTDNQRLALFHAGDTMILDFINITGPNPAGNFLFFDSLTFIPGYFRFDFERLYDDEFAQEVWLLLSHGITPHSIRKLGMPLLSISTPESYLPKLFPTPAPASYLLSEAKHAFSTDQITLGQSILSEASELINTREDYIELLDLQIRIALKNGKDSIALRQSNRLCTLFPSIPFFYQKIALEKQLGLQNEVLQSYDKLISITTGSNQIEAVEKKSAYLLDTMKLPEAIIELIRPALDSIPQKYLADQFIKASEYDRLHFYYGRALWEQGYPTQAIDQWMIAAKYGFHYETQQEKLELIRFFDSLDSSQNLELKLVKVSIASKIASYGYGTQNGWNEDELTSILKDLSYLEERNFSLEQVLYLKALTYFRQANYELSLSTVDRIIEPGTTDQDVYYLRYRINQKLGLAINPYQQDPDIIRSRELQSMWVYPK